MGLLYTKMKIFHYKDKIDSLPAAKKEILAPLHIRMKPTNLCNHNCRYCAYRVKDLQLGQDMAIRDFIPRDKMFEIVSDLAGMGVKALTFSGGGEPFCYPYLLETAKQLVKAGIKFAALSNGARVSGEVAEVFAKHATWLRISMDGWDDKSYSFYRGVPDGEFTKIIANIKNFKKFGGKCYLGVSLIIDKFNAAHLYGLIKKLRESGVNSVKISPCIVSNDGAQNNRYHKPIFTKVKNQASKAIKDFANTDFEVFDSYHELSGKFKKDYSWCPYLQILPIIGADLNIYPCQDKAYNLKEGLIGSIKKQSFKEFWFKNKSKFFKVKPYLHCNHHCVANEKNKLILDYMGADKEHLGFV